MTDIVKRLRALDAWAFADVTEVMHAGAAEIERLRQALRNLLADTQHARHNCGDPDCPVDAARAALKEAGHEA